MVINPSEMDKKSTSLIQNKCAHNTPIYWPLKIILRIKSPKMKMEFKEITLEISF